MKQRDGAYATIIIGLVMVVFVAATLVYSRRAAWYRVAEGVVLDSQVTSEVAGRTNLHEPMIEYSHVVNGIHYRNSSFGMVNNKGSEEWAQRVVESYPKGRRCIVYYDKADPRRSVLTRSLNPQTIIIMLGFTFLGLLSAIRGVIALRLNRL